ncbi:TetR/AcrR family transcriptional regulator [Streptococcus saliviloxodontae]|uniref:AcrR family transcriptional regulator n=1 Tax=Streptococcus saliviloxodontae TaxID=1349416 RepID=A0ABS2PKT7_9STRE|nr:TetR/AcrR family transcriptional regulator [Streptococcus saliviloxodontae]MBM7636049.1 AcrR family transcriptional regulator [Streptococcus saliviloxodontae]
MDHRKENTRKAILKAMVTCLQTQTFNDITTINLARTAGISRSSFYTHFKDKYEMIDSYQKELFLVIEDIFNQHHNDKQAALIDIFSLFKREELLSALISSNGSQELQGFLLTKVRRFIDRNTFERFGHTDLNLVEHDYASIYFSQAVFGIFQAWIAKGKIETPEEMTKLLLKLLP